MKKVLLIIVALLFSTSFCFAQGLGIFGAISMPQGDFGDDSGSGAGLATTGFGVGADLVMPLGSPGLSGVGTVAFLMNKMDKDEIEDSFDLGDDSDLDVGSYMNIPVMGGLRFEGKVSPTMAIYGIGQAGINFIKGPKLEATIEEEVWNGSQYVDVEGTMKTTFDMTSAFGFAFGGGIILNDKINIGFKYLNLGEPELEGEIEVEASSGSSSASENEKIKIDQKVAILLFTVGINLN